MEGTTGSVGGRTQPPGPIPCLAASKSVSPTNRREAVRKSTNTLTGLAPDLPGGIGLLVGRN